jgi:Uma2 family endonuclease
MRAQWTNLPNDGGCRNIARKKNPLSKEELSRRWDEIVRNFERVDLRGWIVETDQYGQIIMSPRPEGIHQSRGVTIIELLEIHFPEHEALFERSVLTDIGVKKPNVILLAPDRIELAMDNQALMVAPKICVEVISPTNTRKEITEKREAYLRAGALEVWICDRNSRMTFFNHEGPLQHSQLCPDFPIHLDLSTRPVAKQQKEIVRQKDHIAEQNKMIAQQNKMIAQQEKMILNTYNRLVKTPEDRKRLEQDDPELVAARDRIVG